MSIEIAIEAVFQRSQNAEDLLPRLISFVGPALPQERTHHEKKWKRDSEAVRDKMQLGWI